MGNGEAVALGLIRGMELAGYSVLLAFAVAGMVLIIGNGARLIAFIFRMKGNDHAKNHKPR